LFSTIETVWPVLWPLLGFGIAATSPAAQYAGKKNCAVWVP